MLPHDDTAALCARLSSCSYLPAGIDENAVIEPRISFERDGTLASQPQLLNASLSPGASGLMQRAVNALQRCQPFSELSGGQIRKVEDARPRCDAPGSLRWMATMRTN